MKTRYIKPETDICTSLLKSHLLLTISGGGIGADKDWADSNSSHFDDSFEDDLSNYGDGLWNEPDKGK